MRKTGLLLLCLLFIQLFFSCNKTDDGAYTAPITVYEKIAGSWTVSSVKETDLIAKAAGAKPNQLTLTSKLNFKTFTITFDVDENNNPTTFAVGGTSPALFLQSGYWKLSNPYPNTDGSALVIELYSDEAKTTLVDELSLSALPGTRKTMTFDLIRESNGVSFVDYEYSVKAKI
ncbi:MAG TPA: DUF5004 domain-containing protein [Prolixibacteraceae bacterium]|nr:DUF5004 domain-containing protein [Prolixibacteraceae bacterium]HPR86342.1 DUF5004 domain-containing protein [Prolixibacteraceae bacterium]